MKHRVLRCLSSVMICMALVSCSSAPSDTAPAVAGYNYRSFPVRALRGELIVVAAPEVRVNGKPSRLSPGSRIRNETNMIVMASTLTNQRVVVNYTFDLTGQIQDIWILSSNERSLTWPRTVEESQRWAYDQNRGAWTPR